MWTIVVIATPALAGAQVQDIEEPDPDLQVVVGEPDFTLGVLPTTLRMPKGKLAFRITHRFTYKINDGSFGEFLENGFGFDSSATTGFELRFGLVPGGQLVVHRTGSRNVQFLGQQQIVAQGDSGPLSLDVVAAVEGQNNFRERYSVAAGGVVSRRLGDRGALYVHPIAVWNATPELPGSDQNTFILGMGTRLRMGASRSYVVAEFAPRLGGYDGGTSLVTVGLERRVGGHVFQINVSNGFGTTLTQVGHGGPVDTHWHLGFNMTRKFF
jgi:hypothetical protein